MRGTTIVNRGRVVVFSGGLYAGEGSIGQLLGRSTGVSSERNVGMRSVSRARLFGPRHGNERFSQSPPSLRRAS